MSDHSSAHDLQKAVRTYLYAGAALILGTFFTVWVAHLHIGSVALTVTSALVIACTKGFLVAVFFMHLISEKKLIYGIMIATVFFFASLMYLTVWSMHPDSLIHMNH